MQGYIWAREALAVQPITQGYKDLETDGSQGDRYRGKWSNTTPLHFKTFDLLVKKNDAKICQLTTCLRVQYSQVMGIWHRVGIIVALSELNDQSGIAWRKTEFVTLWSNMMSRTKTSSIPIMLGLHAWMTWRQRSLMARVNTGRWRVTKSWKLADGVWMDTWKASSSINTSYALTGSLQS